jgi:hypothetical protein
MYPTKETRVYWLIVLNIEKNKEIQVALFMVVGILKIICKHISFGKL